VSTIQEYTYVLSNKSIVASMSFSYYSASYLDLPSTFIGPRVMFSSTVLCGNKLKCWNTMPTFDRTFGTFVRESVISSPSIVIEPDVTSSNKFKQRKKVLFPEPDGPMTHTTSCGFILLEIPLSTS